MSKIRVLVVDDAVVFRRLVARELSEDEAFDVVGTAANGRIALAMMPQVNPDIVILDVEMPEMDGLATLAELRKTYLHVPVIMFSALTERGAAVTLDALALGAADYFCKPTNEGSLEASIEVIRRLLVPEIKALAASARMKREGRRAPAATPSADAKSTIGREPLSAGQIDVLAIGASTGGPNAIAEVFRGLPAGFTPPILIVQHMPPMFTRLLAERLSAQFSIPVAEASTGRSLEPGHAWIAPGDHHLTVVRVGAALHLRLNQDPPENSCRPAVDVLLRSVAREFGPRSLTVILTGMGQDGLRGCEAVRAAGGRIICQDEATSVVWGMPGQVAKAGLADGVLPLANIAGEIVRVIRPSSAGPR